MLLPHFDVFCDLLLNRRTATWNLFLLYNKETNYYRKAFLTRELRMRNTSYRDLWENVSLARWAVNILQMRYARGLLLNCCSSLIEISCFKGLN